MAYSYKGAITFGLVYIPITLSVAVRENDIGFNMLEKNTMSRIKYKKTCVDCDDREVEAKDIIKGYQYEKDKYVIFTDDDFEKLKTQTDKNISITEFVNLAEIDPIYFDRAFYVTPKGGEKAYALLISAMSKEGKAGIAKTVIGTKQTLVVLRVQDGKMLVNTLYFHDEIGKPPHIEHPKIDDAELKLAINLINNMTCKFEPEKYHDEYHQRLERAIEEKIKGNEVTALSEQKRESIVNLMEALTKSLALSKKSASAK